MSQSQPPPASDPEISHTEAHALAGTGENTSVPASGPPVPPPDAEPFSTDVVERKPKIDRYWHFLWALFFSVIFLEITILVAISIFLLWFGWARQFGVVLWPPIS